MPQLTHGPIVGATTENSATLWLRADGPGTAKIQLVTADEMHRGHPGVSRTTPLADDRDYTGLLTFTGLLPDTEYFYLLRLNGEAALFPNYDRQASFRTFPAADAPAPAFSFAFGSCFNSLHNEDVIFRNLTGETGVDPRFFLMIGDNTYADYYARTRREESDAPIDTLLGFYRESYRASWKYPTFQRGLRRTPTYMIFDDHEIWNNWNNIPDHRQDDEASQAARRAYWEYQDCHNPNAETRHAGPEPDYHYTFSYGSDVGFFVLDGRMRRNPRAVPFPTILGEAQRRDLYRWLKENRTRYRAKFIVSPVPVSFIALPHTIVQLLHGELGDQWIGYQEERLELFKFIQRENIEGVHFLSGDIHLGQGLVIESESDSPGPTVYSYTSSPLANVFYLLPEKTPGWFTPLFWSAIGVLSGVLLALLPGLSLLSGVALGLALSAGLALLWRRDRQRRGPQYAGQPDRLEKLIYQALRTVAHQTYLRQLMGVARDEIKGANVHYSTKNMFPAVNAYNMGVVTVSRAEPDGAPTVHFRLVDPDGEALGAEPGPHLV